jgi:hypothetical protein
VIPLEAFATIHERIKPVIGERGLFYREVLGYQCPIEIDGTVCGLMRFAFTWAIVVGIDEVGYSHRYCYDSLAAAMKAYLEWMMGGAYEPAGYIVRKGLGPDHRPAP